METVLTVEEEVPAAVYLLLRPVAPRRSTGSVVPLRLAETRTSPK